MSVNGAPALWDFDVFAAAGAKNRAVVRSFGTDASAAGQIVIAFHAQNNFAMVAGIEIQQAGLVPASPADNITNHYDAYRTSWDPQEQAFTVAGVSPSSFGLLKQLWVDASVDAQPLVATGVYVPTLGARHDLLIVATERDSIYAFDANTYAPIWQRSLLGRGERNLDIDDVAGCTDLVVRWESFANRAGSAAASST